MPRNAAGTSCVCLSSPCNLDLIWWANDDLIWTIKSLSGKWNHVHSSKIWSELQLSGNEEHLGRKTVFLVWADVGIPCGAIPEQAKEEHVRIPDIIWCMWHEQILNDVVILSLAHVSSSHPSPYPWRGSWFMLQPEDNAQIKHIWGDTSAGLQLWDQTPISQGCVLQTGKLSPTPTRFNCSKDLKCWVNR